MEKAFDALVWHKRYVQAAPVNERSEHWPVRRECNERNWLVLSAAEASVAEWKRVEWKLDWRERK